MGAEKLKLNAPRDSCVQNIRSPESGYPLRLSIPRLSNLRFPAYGSWLIYAELLIVIAIISIP